MTPTIPTPDSVRLPESADELLQQLKNLYVVIEFLEDAWPGSTFAKHLAEAKEEYLELYSQAKTYEALAGEDTRLQYLVYAPYVPLVMPTINKKLPLSLTQDILNE